MTIFISYLWVAGDLRSKAVGSVLFLQLLDEALELFLQSSLVKLLATTGPLSLSWPSILLLLAILDVSISCRGSLNLDVSHPVGLLGGCALKTILNAVGYFVL